MLHSRIVHALRIDCKQAELPRYLCGVPACAPTCLPSFPSSGRRNNLGYLSTGKRRVNELASREFTATIWVCARKSSSVAARK